MQTKLYAVGDVVTETDHKAAAGDVVATIDHEIPLDKLLAGLQIGSVTTDKPKAKSKAKSDAKPEHEDGHAKAVKATASEKADAAAK